MAKIATKETNAENGTVTFNFEDGETVTVSASDFPESVVQNLVVYGLSQKLGDAYSGEKDPSTARAIVEVLTDRMKQGEFNKQREGGGGGSRVSQLAEALSRETGKELDVCVSKVAELKAQSTEDDDKVAALRKNPRIKMHLETIKAEKAQLKQKELEKEAAEAAPINL